MGLIQLVCLLIEQQFLQLPIHTKNNYRKNDSKLDIHNNIEVTATEKIKNFFPASWRNFPIKKKHVMFDFMISLLRDFIIELLLLEIIYRFNWQCLVIQGFDYSLKKIKIIKIETVIT